MSTVNAIIAEDSCGTMLAGCLATKGTCKPYISVVLGCKSKFWAPDLKQRCYPVQISATSYA